MGIVCVALAKKKKKEMDNFLQKYRTPEIQKEVENLNKDSYQ